MSNAKATLIWSCKPCWAHCLCPNLCLFSCQSCSKMAFIRTVVWVPLKGQGGIWDPGTERCSISIAWTRRCALRLHTTSTKNLCSSLSSSSVFVCGIFLFIPWIALAGDVFALEIGLPTQLCDGYGVHFWPRRERQTASAKSLFTLFFKFGRRWFNYGSTSKSL